MGILNFFRKLTGDGTPHARQSNQIEKQQPKPLGESSPFREYTYVRIADRKNRYDLVVTENIVSDGGAAETYEQGLVDRFLCYDNMICPNCGAQLAKVPKQRGKCTHCKKPIHVIKSYIELDRPMLLTLQEKESLKKYRNTFFKFKQISKELDNLGITKTDYDRARGELNHNFSYRDVIWRLLNDKSLEDFNNMQLGTHSNVHRVIGVFLEEEGKYKTALQQYLYLIYLDLNGSMNMLPSSHLKECFDASIGFIAPGAIGAVITCMDKGDMSLDDVRKEFMELKKRQLPTPLTVLQSWNKFKKEYDKIYSENN